MAGGLVVTAVSEPDNILGFVSDAPDYRNAMWLTCVVWEDDLEMIVFVWYRRVETSLLDLYTRQENI